MAISTHRVIQISELEDKLTANIRMNYIRAEKSASIGNRNAARFFTSRAKKAEMLMQYRVLPRLSLINATK